VYALSKVGRAGADASIERAAHESQRIGFFIEMLVNT
jgi:hypothetical protein